jgi:hypothetical protein
MAKQFWAEVFAVPTSEHGIGEWVSTGRATSVSAARRLVREAGYRVRGVGGIARLGTDPMDNYRLVYSVTVHPKKR